MLGHLPFTLRQCIKSSSWGGELVLVSLHMSTYTSLPPQEAIFFASICRAKNDPPVTKSGYGLLLGCRSPLDSGPFENTFFDDVRTQNPGIFTVCSDPLSQSIGRGRVTREGALDLRESRERRDKIFAEKKKTPKKWIKNSSFQWGIFIFLAAEKLTFLGGV